MFLAVPSSVAKMALRAPDPAAHRRRLPDESRDGSAQISPLLHDRRKPLGGRIG